MPRVLVGALGATVLLLGLDKAQVLHLRSAPPVPAAPVTVTATRPPRAANVQAARPDRPAAGLAGRAVRTAATASAPAPDPYAALPDPERLPDDAFGRLVRRGRELIAETPRLIGPEVGDPAMRYAGNNLACQNCHLRGAIKRNGLPLAGVWGLYPEYTAREGTVSTLEDRINGCMERSMNGRPLPPDGPEMRAMLAYVRFVSAGEPVGRDWPGRGAPALPLPARAADPERGAGVYAGQCAACHGADGQGQRRGAAGDAQGYLVPPLWGPDSYNTGAGMGRVITAARFLHANMPPGATAEEPGLSVDDAFDVAAFVNARPRPTRVGQEADFPDRWRKPVDAPQGPWPDPFPAEQHRFGPWPPILEWLRANAPR
jgi:thiosulfate dehydrogenase